MNFKTLLFTVMSTLFLGSSMFGQTPVIPNGNFENWENTGALEEPVSWNSNKTGSGYATLPSWSTCIKETSSPYNGTYCARIESKTYIVTVVNGAMTTGRVMAPSMTKAEGYIQSIKNDPNFGCSFNGRPDSVIGYYKYTSVSGDGGKVRVILHVGNYYDPEVPVSGNHPDSSMNKIADGVFLTPTSSVSTWTKFAIKLNYVDNRTPQYILINATSSASQTGGKNGSKLWLDGLQAIYNPAVNTGTISPLVYNVSATMGTSVSVPFTAIGTFNSGNIFTAQLSDASGSFASPTIIGTFAGTNSGTISATIPAGTVTGAGYKIRVIASNPAITGTAFASNIQINNCSNSISPATLQSICENGAGSMISVTETPAATSREWKFATVSGGPYNSFSTPVTTTTYTPMFATAGTYYVVCESHYSGLTLTSNQTEINVTMQPASGSINPNPSTSVVCSGDMVSATFTSGNGGAGTVQDITEICYNNDNNWIAYTPGTSIATTGYTSIAVRTYRTASSGSCTASTAVTYQWNIAIPGNLAATNITGSSADLSWTDAIGSAWNIEYDVTGFTLGTGTLQSNLTSQSYSVSGLTSGTNYDFYVQSNCGTMGSSWVGPFTFTTGGSGNTTKVLNVTVLLEGLYDAANPGTMRKAQGFDDDFNLTDQYSGTIADMVTVELHNATEPYDIAYEYSPVALNVDGTLSIDNLPGTISGTYYIAIKHRNSIQTWSANPVDFSGTGPFVFNFTLDPSNTYGYNLKDLLDGFFAIYGGDVDQDGGISIMDMGLVDNQAASFGGGYIPEDIDGDGGISIMDMGLVDNNASTFVGFIIPGSKKK